MTLPLTSEYLIYEYKLREIQRIENFNLKPILETLFCKKLSDVTEEDIKNFFEYDSIDDTIAICLLGFYFRFNIYQYIRLNWKRLTENHFDLLYQHGFIRKTNTIISNVPPHILEFSQNQYEQIKHFYLHNRQISSILYQAWKNSISIIEIEENVFL